MAHGPRHDGHRRKAEEQLAKQGGESSWRWQDRATEARKLGANARVRQGQLPKLSPAGAHNQHFTK